MPVLFSRRFFVSANFSSLSWLAKRSVIDCFPSTYSLDEEFERISMRLIWFALEVKCMDEMSWISIDLFLRNAFSNKSNVVRNTDNAILPGHFLIYLIVMHPIDTNRTLGLLVIQLSFLDKARDEVANIPILRNKYIKYFLYVSINVRRSL